MGRDIQCDGCGRVQHEDSFEDHVCVDCVARLRELESNTCSPEPSPYPARRSVEVPTEIRPGIVNSNYDNQSPSVEAFHVGEPVVDAATGKVTVDVELRSPFPVLAQMGPPGRLGRSHQDKLIDNTDARVQAPRDLAQEVYGFFRAGGSRIYVDGPGVGTPATAASEAPCCEACAEFEAEMAAEQTRDQAKAAARKDRLREALAAYAHEAWSGWMQYQSEVRLQMERHGKSVITWVLAEDYDRWYRQMKTPYADLPEEEKASDRVQADKILAILRGEG